MNPSLEKLIEKEPKKISFNKRMKVSPCLTWPGSLSNEGYAIKKIKGKQYSVHKTVYEVLVEKVPQGLVLDHLCRNRACINPFHLEIVTNKENVLRGISFAAVNSKKKVCEKRGHPFDANINGRRVCHECKRIEAKIYYWKNWTEINKKATARRKARIASRTNLQALRQ